MASLKQLQHLQIPLEQIKLATNHFSDENRMWTTGFWVHYKGELQQPIGRRTVVVKRLDGKLDQGEHEFLMEITVLCYYSHEILVPLVGFCDESGEKIIVYEYQTHGSLDNHLSSPSLSWMQRLHICLGVARGLKYLHSDEGSQVFHRDIKSGNILLNMNFEPKISGFELSIINHANQQFRLLITDACGTPGYIDPRFEETGTVTDKSDVYSFGVVLFEVLCGRLAYRNYEDGSPLIC